MSERGLPLADQGVRGHRRRPARRRCAPGSAATSCCSRSARRAGFASTRAPTSAASARCRRTWRAASRPRRRPRSRWRRRRCEVVPPARPAVLVEALLLAAEAFDATRFDALLDAAFAFGQLTAIRDVVLPTLVEIGTRWESADITVGHEHFASHLIERRLLGLAQGWEAGRGPLALLACPSGERHTLGLVCFGLLLADRGWRIAYLGADTPVEQVADVSASMEPDVVILCALDSLHLSRNAAGDRRARRAPPDDPRRRRRHRRARRARRRRARRRRPRATARGARRRPAPAALTARVTAAAAPIRSPARPRRRSPARARQQAQLAREVLRRGEVDGLAQRDAQRRGDALAGRRVRAAGLLRRERRGVEHLDVLEREDGLAALAGPRLGRDEHVDAAAARDELRRAERDDLARRARPCRSRGRRPARGRRRPSPAVRSVSAGMSTAAFWPASRRGDGDARPRGEAARDAADRERARADRRARRDRLAGDDDVDEPADPPRQRRLAAGDVRRGEPAEHEREAAEQQRARRRRLTTRRPQERQLERRSRAPRDAGAATSRPPWRSAISAAIARPRPRRPRPPRARRVSSATGAGRPGPSSMTSMRTWRQPIDRAPSARRGRGRARARWRRGSTRPGRGAGGRR